MCVVGLHREAVRDIKNQIGTLLKVPIPLESFHVKSPADIKVDLIYHTVEEFKVQAWSNVNPQLLINPGGGIQNYILRVDAHPD